MSLGGLARGGVSPSREPRLGHPGRRFLAGAAGVAVLAGLTIVTLGVAVALVPAPAPDRTSRPTDPWVEVNRPIELFALAGTDFARRPHLYRARRHVEGGGRQDTIAYGELQADTPSLELDFYRPGREAAPVLPLSDVIGGIVGDQGVASVGAPTALPTRFGPFDVADVVLTSPGPACLGFSSRSAPEDAVRIAGLFCGSAAKPAARDSLGCILDRIDLLSAGDDLPLRQIFVEAERRRGASCAPSPLVSAGTRTTWLDVNATLPVLRGSPGLAAARW